MTWPLSFNSTSRPISTKKAPQKSAKSVSELLRRAVYDGIRAGINDILDDVKHMGQLRAPTGTIIDGLISFAPADVVATHEADGS